MKLDPAQLQFLADKGLSIDEIIQFASMTPDRSKGAERQARYRERQKAAQDSDITSDVTSNSVTESDAPPLSRPLSPQTPQTPTHTPEKQTRARKGPDFPCPDWADPEVWRDLKANRRAKRLANTPTAHRQFVNAVEAMADDHWPPGRLVEAIVAKGWGGAHDPRDDRKPRNDNRKQNSNRNAADLARQKLGLSH